MTPKQRAYFKEMLDHEICEMCWPSPSGTHICIRAKGHNGQHWCSCEAEISRGEFRKMLIGNEIVRRLIGLHDKSTKTEPRKEKLMCNLCGTPEEQERGRKQKAQKADDFFRMAKYCEQLANGSLKPHSDDMKKVTSLAHTLIRELINDYL